MSLLNPNASIQAIDGAAANVAAQLQCLTLTATLRLAALGIDADHRLYFSAGAALPEQAVLTLGGKTYRVVRSHPACDAARQGEALLKLLPSNPAPA